ncbi:receptor-type tyrosine-protein phosphatase alpha-like isoform X2 [Dreissena polymorpha]|uniref:receptor-type tyrosine-protein phosphatase alpha-like isoform X2 n=1 Tax=Dreissena polymorpha TaxID=45954 RepID=UPI002264AAE4|nr:receptor-type tyrosine-protein phosphatase alpha-like isoform X2 [Dreissena polymorpha]
MEKEIWKYTLVVLILPFMLLDLFQTSEAAPCDELGRFGWKCRFSCNCADGADCERQTGYCQNGCKPGFYGWGCQFADDRIYGEQRGTVYTGSYMKAGNQTCINWNNPRIQVHLDKYRFLDKTIPGAVCRNPLVVDKQAYNTYPWCYIEVNGAIAFDECRDLIVTVCPDYLHGDKCDKECHCSNWTEVCDKSTGFCRFSKCHAGWFGIGCDIPCSPMKFGIDCAYDCGNCLHNMCDHETGLCTSGCKPGFSGTYCRTACTDGTFGSNCEQTCGFCNMGVCSPINGQCQGGCKPGYRGSLCKELCPAGSYGNQCERQCPYCHNKGPCHPETGVCERGCMPGFMGPKCDAECLDGAFGPNCTGVCGHCMLGKPCDIYRGHCIGGCADGYTGDQCLAVAVIVKEGGVMVEVLVGVIAGIILVVLIIAFVCYRRRRFSRTLEVSSKSADRKFFTKEATLESVRETEKETDLLLESNSLNTHSKPTFEEDEGVVAEDSMDVTHYNHEPIYVNLNNHSLTNPIPVEKLQAFIKKARETDFDVIKGEHRDLPTGLLALCHTALKPENKPKNRYADIIAYDHSRVVLTPLSHDPHSDYVNANYLDGYNSKKAYIASQGPNKAMVADFWRMIWQEKVVKIVMLTNLLENHKKKCEQYWPLEGSQTYGEVTVEGLETAEYTDYIIRTFTISVGKMSRIIKQFHFLSWTDHGAPTYPTTLLNFRRKVQQFTPDSVSPILIHCSAGIGRSGTYVAVDYLLNQARAEGVVDLLKCAQLMRSNRVNMIQTWQQYSFVYDAVLDALMSGETTIPNSLFPERYEDLCTLKPEASSTLLEEQFETLQSLTPVLDRDECGAAIETINLQKSRVSYILPANRFRPHLFTPVDNCNDFINAVFLPSYTQNDHYIVTQMPLPNTVADFWRLLYDYHSDTVVMLNEFDRNDKSCALYWPEEYGYTVEYGPLSIELLFSSEADPNITVRTFKLTHRTKGEDRAVKQFQFNAWPDYKSVPVGTSGLLRLTDAVQEWMRQNGKGPVTVHCMNGASKSGLFCACSLMFERMRMDMEVDIYQTVKQIRINRPHFVENMEQYQFLYQMALASLERQPLGMDRQMDRQTNDSIDSGIQDRLL